MPVLQDNKEEFFEEKITIRFGSYDKNRLLKPNNFINHTASKLKLDLKSFVSLKKKAKHRFTVISGPHVHKKSRQQYRIDSYVSFFVFELKSKEDFIKFSNLKQELYQNNIDQGSDITFKHSRTEKISFADL
jgi:ribosomal protein S10